jgi:hypothetical protein
LVVVATVLSGVCWATGYRTGVSLLSNAAQDVRWRDSRITTSASCARSPSEHRSSTLRVADLKSALALVTDRL